jgi:hypothetical protein
MLPPKNFFSNYQNKAEFKNLDDSEVFSSDFSSLRNFCCHIDLISLASATSVVSAASTVLFLQKNFLILIIPDTKMTNMDPFLAKNLNK